MPTKDTQSRIDVRENDAPASCAASPEGERARRRRAAPAPGSVPVASSPPGVRERLTDELIDELLAGARTRRRSSGPAGCWAS